MNMLAKKPALQLSQNRKRNFIEIFLEEIQHFCQETNLHGWKFAAFKESTTLDRSIWALIVATAIVSVVVLLNIAYTTFINDPTVIFTESTHSMVWNYPFPAITICNYNQISKTAVLEFIKSLKTNISHDILFEDMKMLFQLIAITNFSIPRSDLSKLHAILEENKVEVDVLLESLAPKCEKMLNKCKWKGEERRCKTLFESQKTPNGFCCTFNFYGIERKNNIIDQRLRMPLTARRISACGFRTGLEILIQSYPEDYFATQIPSFGHLILINPPYNYPHLVSGTFALPMGGLNFFSVQPAETYATDNVRSLSINERNCAFANEIKLQTFAKYSYQNCLAECRMNITRELCGCIPFYYINANGTYPKIRVCNLKDVYCLRNNYYLLMSSKPGFTYNKENQTEPRFKCRCYKNCETYTYKVQLSASKVSRKYSSNQLDLYGGAELINSTVIRIFYTDLVGIKNRNDVRYDLDGLIALYGGLLSLFLGFSCVSSCEIIYFLIICTLIEVFKKPKRNKINVEMFKRKH